LDYYSKKKLYLELEEELPKAEHDFYLLSHYRKVVLAEQMKNAAENGAKTSASQERDARSSEEYKNVLEAGAEALERKTRLWMKYNKVRRELGL